MSLENEIKKRGDGQEEAAVATWMHDQPGIVERMAPIDWYARTPGRLPPDGWAAPQFPDPWCDPPLGRFRTPVPCHAAVATSTGLVAPDPLPRPRPRHPAGRSVPAYEKNPANPIAVRQDADLDALLSDRGRHSFDAARLIAAPRARPAARPGSGVAVELIGGDRDADRRLRVALTDFSRCRTERGTAVRAWTAGAARWS